MRNPSMALHRMPQAKNPAWQVRELLYKAQDLWKEMRETAAAILSGSKPKDLDVRVVEAVRKAATQMLGGSTGPRQREARAETPINANLIEAWGHAAGDRDSPLLAKWLDDGAPLGFTEDIPTTGVFPAVQGPSASAEAIKGMTRTLEDWQNYKSALEESEDLNQLIQDYMDRGFCHKVSSMAEAEQELGRTPVLNKLGVVVKYSPTGKKKARIVWDLKESQANTICNQKERIILPRLLDLASQAVAAYREQKDVWLAAVDIRDAFMNIPAGKDKFMTVAAWKEEQGGPDGILIFDTLVFGSASSPTIWARFAAWLGRSTSAISPSTGLQIYVDDPGMCLPGKLEEAVRELTSVLLWFAISGFPVKLEKAEGGKSINWVGATITAVDKDEEVVVTIPKEKVEKLQATTLNFLKRPVVGHRQLRSFAGSLSFVAGLVPHLRPFLSTFWAVLAGVGAANDGAGTRHSGKLLHTRRFKAALRWIEALLRGAPAPLTRTLSARFTEVKATITTDASPWGIGGVMRVEGCTPQCFSSPIPAEALKRFKAQTGLSKFNTVWEGLALLVAFRIWLPSLGHGAQVRAKSDNVGVLYMIYWRENSRWTKHYRSTG